MSELLLVMGDPDMEQVAEEGAPQRRALKTFFGNITEKNVRQLRILNLEALPVQYSDKFYRDIVKDEDNPICKFSNLLHACFFL